MEAIIFISALVLGLVAFDGLAVRFGVDSTEGSRDPRSGARILS